MTTLEFSNEFDILYNNVMSNLAPGLDEYEKSVFLTEALDNLIKRYFSRGLNPTGDGFDDNIRRLMDFSTLITVKSIDMSTATKGGFSDNGYLVSFKDSDFISDDIKAYPLFLINEKVANKGTIVTPAKEATEGETKLLEDDNTDGIFWVKNTSTKLVTLTIKYGQPSLGQYEYIGESPEGTTINVSSSSIDITLAIALGKQLSIGDLISEVNADTAFNIYIKLIEDLESGIDTPAIESSVSVTLTGKTEAVPAVYNNGDSYVVVPINCKDYDRIMSKAYNEPLKRQAWRLFESDSTTLSRLVEIILRTDAGEPNTYTIRYVRKPRPIILTDLSTIDSTLTINGVSAKTECELDSIIHREILKEAVRLAVFANDVLTKNVSLAQANQ